MKTMNKVGAVLGVVGVLALGGCGTMSNPFGTSSAGTATPGTASTGTAYSGYGVVQSIDVVQQASTGYEGIGGTGYGLGTVAGAVVGGVLGHQVGSGTGNTVATVAGAAGGAYVGHQLEKGQQEKTADVYRFTIRMDGGAFQTLTQNTNTGFKVGDRVRIENGILQRA
jgi:outer membrane lipoprotein SlyB